MQEIHDVQYPFKTLVPLRMNKQPYVASDGGISFAKVLLQADVGQRILPEDGLGVQVGCHEPTLSRESLERSS